MSSDEEEAALPVSLREPEGFVALYKRESELVLVFCTRRVMDAEAALDLTAETFAQAFRSRGSFRGSTRAEARAWLLTIARRQVARFLRRGMLDKRATERLAIQTPVLEPDETAEIERRAGLDAIRGELEQRVADLSADQRDALRLRVIEQRSYAEVAEALGVNEATARARVSRALRALAAVIEPRVATGGGVATAGGST
jgi:RNA polymerase sigma-70 factor (ECF subfamily)